MARQAYIQAPTRHCKACSPAKAVRRAEPAPVSGKARKLAGGQTKCETNETLEQALVRMFQQIPPHKQLRVAMLLLTIIFVYEMVERDRQLQAERQAILAGYQEANLQLQPSTQTFGAEEDATVPTQQEDACGAQQPSGRACEPIDESSVAGHPPVSVVVPTLTRCHGAAILASSSSFPKLSVLACVLSSFQQHLAHVAAIVTLFVSGLVGISCTVVVASGIGAVERLSSVYRLALPGSSVAA